MNVLRTSLLFAGLALAVWGCQSKAENTSSTVSTDDIPSFRDYWYRGQAEITSYTLQQARYGAMHEGEAVLVFVTEPFSKSKQVKLDYEGRAGDDAVGVLKLNLTKKFYTGVYPYSIMQSTFTPVNADQYPNTIKVSMSSQEWCGHTYTQLNLNEDGSYHYSGKSYFESEGDVEQELPQALLEDDVWARIRLNPEDLPTGSFQMLPGSVFARLRHVPYKPYMAEGKLGKGKDGLRTYTLTYPELRRSLVITFTEQFPHTIEGWEETTPSGWGAGSNTLTTVAKRNQRIMSDYWSRNQPQDASLREELGLK